jgi:serine/threonine-protein kinase
VALKFLRQCEVCPEEERARVFREARAASSLNHPNIAVIYDVEESQTSDGPVFLLAMEYVPGKTLAELSSDPALAFDDILHIIEQTAGALAEAHARGVVHRDIKPSNIMVAQGRVKVLDFGLARVDPRLPDDATTWSRDLATTRDGDVVGTPHYMSPEQALGGNARAWSSACWPRIPTRAPATRARSASGSAACVRASPWRRRNRARSAWPSPDSPTSRVVPKTTGWARASPKR